MRVAVGLIILLLTACVDRQPSARIGGDADGVPVMVTAIYDREALPALAQGAGFTRTVVVERDGWSDPFWPHHHHFHHHYHPWHSPGYAYEPMTTLTLLIGDGPAEAQVLRARMVPGTNTWSVPLRPGRPVVVSLQADGGRQGWREIGRFTAAPGLNATVHLAGAQPRLETTLPVPLPPTAP